MSAAEAVYVVEFTSISRGIGALDLMCKRAGLAVLYANPICIGKYLICAGGDVADMLEVKAAAEAEDDEPPIASCLITGTHPAVLRYFRREKTAEQQNRPALGIFETRNASSGIKSLDAALKAARVELVRIWLGTQLGGKLCWVISGGVSDVKSGVAASQSAVARREQAGSRVVIAPDPLVLRQFGGE